MSKEPPGMGGEENGELLFNEYRVLVLQDGNVLEIHCNVHIIHTTVLYTKKWLR